jgi:N-acetyl sugar amidotransferase
MDKTDPEITFDDYGVCNYCTSFAEIFNKYCFTPEEEEANLKEMTRLVRSSPGKDGYDSIVGMSGGVDSSYVALLANRMGVKPLCVHFDNGWNSETAVSNIKSLVDRYGFDLYTYVINWPEFRDLQRAFIKSGVIDLEMLSDHAIFASLFLLRRQYGIKYVLSGTNFRTENGLPQSWIWSKMDWQNIKDIHARFGEVPIKTFPRLPTFKWQLIRHLGIGGVFLEPLNKIDYSKVRAMKELEAVGWRYYGGKHYESIITKFYQTYYLPKKFGVDKRRCHVSALIRNGEISREAALMEISAPPISPDEAARDKEFVLKKLGFSEKEFDHYMASPVVKHDKFKSDRLLMNYMNKIGKFVLRRP